jgi:hypothetical protein
MLGRIDTGKSWRDALLDKRARRHGERIPEYVFAYDAIRRLRPDRLLDVGCVLNDPLFDTRIPPSCTVSFLNPASEKIARRRAVYYCMPLEEFRPFAGFPLVTCLSTLEHIGFDNTRYGTDLIDEGWDWPRAIREWIANVRNLTAFVEPGGTLVVSCPYGQKEFVQIPPSVGVRTWQVIHSEHISALTADQLLAKSELVFLRCDPEGWVEVNADASFPPYGAVCPGASGVLLLSWKS